MGEQYIVIDLKSFYASVECVERGLDPMTTNLVVADPERSEKTICLAVTPAMKALGVHNRCRLFEIPKAIPYIIAEPRMKLYMDYSAEIYSIYLRYVAASDIHVYSIDEAFIDLTHYLAYYGLTAYELSKKIMQDIFKTTGIRATCGVGTNMYLAKIALDIIAKRSPDFIGVLDEESYRKKLWQHTPLTDFWRIGRGTAERLRKIGIRNMQQLAEADEDLLYRVFGVDAELLIDHAWGREPVRMEHIKNYKPRTNSLTSGQVLMSDYDFEHGRLIVNEMMDLLCLEMVEKQVVTNSVSLYVGYSNQAHVPGAKGTASLCTQTNADRVILPAVSSLYERIVNKRIPIKRVCISCNNIIHESSQQLSLFEDVTAMDKSHDVQLAVLQIKNKFGKNAILKGMNFEEGAMTKERNHQIGGHKSGC